MNSFEIALFCITSVVVFVYLLYLFRSWKISLGLTILVWLPIFLSIERVSQFLTVDETGFMDQAIYSEVGDPRRNAWLLGTLRTTLLPSAVLGRVRHKFLADVLSVAETKSLLKCIHWFVGFLLLLAVHYLLDQHFVDPKRRHSFFFIYMVGMFLLPTNNTALKVYNYDSVSMLLGIISLLYLYLALKKGESRDALIAVGIGYLAAQEKRDATPILLVSLSTFAYLKSVSGDLRFKHGRAAIFLGLGTLVALAIGLPQALVMARLNDWNQLDQFIVGVIDPISGWSIPFFFFLLESGQRGYYAIQYWLLIPSVILTYGLSVLLAYGARLKAQYPDALERLDYRWIGGLLVVALLLGIGGIYALDVRLSPQMPVAPGDYQPVGSLNNLAPHFGAHTLVGHIAASIVYAYGMHAVGLPTIYWIGFGVLFLFGALGRQKFRSEPALAGFTILALLTPLAFGILQAHLQIRYLRIPYFLLAMAFTVHLANSPLISDLFRRRLMLIGYAGLLLWEVWPFGPLYAPFHPIWASYSQERNTTAVMGRRDLYWQGWGEELMLAGQQLERQCMDSQPVGANTGTAPCDSLTLYTVFTGEWLGDHQIVTIPFFKVDGKELPYTEMDYYVINRLSVVLGLARLPEGVEPEFVISYRGYVQAWVFRGDRLKEANFQFD